MNEYIARLRNSISLSSVFYYLGGALTVWTIERLVFSFLGFLSKDIPIQIEKDVPVWIVFLSLLIGFLISIYLVNKFSNRRANQIIKDGIDDLEIEPFPSGSIVGNQTAPMLLNDYVVRYRNGDVSNIDLCCLTISLLNKQKIKIELAEIALENTPYKIKKYNDEYYFIPSN